MDNMPTGKYAPLSPWAYFGLEMLFNIPVLGFVFLVVFSLSSGNINRRNFARSHFCVLVILLVIALIVVLIAGGSGLLTVIMNFLNGGGGQIA